MNMMRYRGYIATIEFDNEDRIFIGHLAGINDIIGFHGSSVDELETAFHEAVDEYIAISEQTGRPAQRPYSGVILGHPLI
ncbi:type II toxin-antitoxin system HicB family antitoxin [Endozoicomonas sp. Mp262]|uniref:type II toxin-antitoxin system HicB family antitoxin n=1 Tax=Endozoicomonas sp. Mp262 TaxID=2919499 RepID=UPI0021DB099F